MSLINQALKKEQQRRSLNLRGDSVSDIPTYDSGNVGNGLSPSVRQSNRSLSILLGFTGVGALLLVLGIGFVYFGKSYLNQLNSTPMVSQAETSTSFAAETPETPVTTVSDILKEIEEEKQELLTAEAASNEEIANPDSETEAPQGTAAEETSEVELQEGEPEESATAEKAPAEPEYDFKIQNLIDELQVLGYRSAGVNSRLLMNGRVFKIDDIIDNERGIRFIGSDGESLVFEAPSGYRYRKPL